MKLTEFGIRERVFVELTLLFLLVLGVASYWRLPRALHSEVSFQTAVVTTILKGGSPEEVEKLITLPLEEEVKKLITIERLISVSQENLSTLVVEFVAEEKDLDKLVQDLQNEVNKVTNLPAEAERPVVKGLEVAAYPVAVVALASELEPDRFRVIAEDLADRLETLRDVAKAEVVGHLEPEVWVELDPRRLAAYGLSLAQVAAALAQRNRDVTGGDVPLGRSDLIVRSLGKFQRVEEMEGLVLRRSGEGGVVYLRDVGRARRAHRKAQVAAALDGKPAIFVQVLRKKGGDTIRIMEELREELARFDARYGDRVRSTVIFDTSREIGRRIETLQVNALWGAALVLATLWLFLGVRNALFAFLGVPVSLLFAFLAMGLAGITLNAVSLFAMVLVLGVLVDDSIIVVENSHRHLEAGLPAPEAALRGSREVVLAVTASVLTNIAAFLPMYTVVGIIGRFLAQIPTIVVILFLASLFECFFMLPSHFAHYARRLSAPAGRGAERPFFLRPLKRLYARLLALALRRRYAVAALALGLLGLSVLLIPRVLLFPSTDAFPRFDVKVWMQPGTRLEETQRVLERIRRVVRERVPPGEVESVLTAAGHLEENFAFLRGDHLGMVTVLLHESRGEHFGPSLVLGRGVRRGASWLAGMLPPGRAREGLAAWAGGGPRLRSMATEEILALLRPAVASIPGIHTVRFERMLEGPPKGAPVEIAVRGRDFRALERLAGRLKEFLKGLPGVVEVTDNYRSGKPELRLRVDEAKSRLYGLGAGEVADTVRAAFEGLKATTFHDGDEEIDVLVKLLPPYRAQPEDVLDLPLINARGHAVPLKEVASFEYARGLDRILRRDGRRAITVTADLAGEATSKWVNEQVKAAAPRLLEGHPGYSFAFGGEYQKTQEALESFYRAFALALVLIYFILGAQFRSFAQPLLIMAVIPFGAVGVFFGLFVSGSFLTFPAMLGLVALSGIVVNDSLVLVDFINRYRADGHGAAAALPVPLSPSRPGGLEQSGQSRSGPAAGGSLLRAILRAGRVRLRPILLTSITTILGLLPMALGVGGRSELWMPLANAMMWGLAFSTVLTLFVVPVIYLLLEDAKGFLRRASSGGVRPGAGEPALPAAGR